ncbi:MAG TPA: hypothetical protein VM580_07255 [Labilithrix sp.]|nr:hypothetical protein [Labilithrix sp.]
MKTSALWQVASALGTLLLGVVVVVLGVRVGADPARAVAIRAVIGSLSVLVGAACVRTAVQQFGRKDSDDSDDGDEGEPRPVREATRTRR